MKQSRSEKNGTTCVETTLRITKAGKSPLETEGSKGSDEIEKGMSWNRLCAPGSFTLSEMWRTAKSKLLITMALLVSTYNVD